MSLLGVMEWLASTSWSIALHESLYMYPLIESTHVLTLALFVGLAVMLDLRMLGLAMRRVPVSEVPARLLPWTKAGFVVMVITGRSSSTPSQSGRIRACSSASRSRCFSWPD